MALSTKQMLIVTLSVIILASLIISLNNDDSEAAPSSNLTRVSVEAFSDNSENYDALVYLNNELPTLLNPSEWMQDDNGLWHNVNINNVSYGNLLTYGFLGNVSVDVIRDDIQNWFSSKISVPGTYDILQLKYEVIHDCTFNISINATGMTGINSVCEETHRFDSWYFNDNYQGVQFFVIDSASGDLKPTLSNNVFQVIVNCDGNEVFSREVEVLGDSLTLNGAVTDYDGAPIKDASISYNAGSGSSQSVVTDSSGKYSIQADYGSTVTISSIIANGYTFEESTYTYGTVLADVPVGPVFKANERSVAIKVIDQSGRPVQNAPVHAAWYYQTGTPGNFIILAEIPQSGIAGAARMVSDTTDSDGITTLAFTLPVVEATVTQLYVSVDIGSLGNESNYTYVVDTIRTGTGLSDPIPGVLTGEGNAYVNTGTLDTVTLKCEQSSLEVKVTDTTGAVDLNGISLDAQWYYEFNDGAGIYTIGTDLSAHGLMPGIAWADDTNSSGISVVHYTTPVGVYSTNLTTYLVISGKSSNYEFETVTLKSNTGDSLIAQVTVPGMVALERNSIVNSAISAKDNAFTVTYKVTGDIPDMLEVYYTLGEVREMFSAEKVGGVLEFIIPVKAGVSGSIDVIANGYTMTNSSLNLPTITEDVTYTSVSTADVATLSRAVPVPIGSPFTIEGLAVNDQITFMYSIGGTSITFMTMVDLPTYSYQPYGWLGNMVTSFTLADSSGLYVKSDGSNNFVVAHLVEKNIVTYSSLHNYPEVSTTTPNLTLTVLVDGTIYTTVRTNISGIGFVTIPDVDSVTYRYGNYNVSSSLVDGGPFDGYLAFNFINIIDVKEDVFVELSVKYTASNGLDGDSVVIVTPEGTSMTARLKVGENSTLEAPELKGFEFSGWYLNGTLISNTSNKYLCTISATEDMDGQPLIAAYSVYDGDSDKAPLDTTSIAIGMVGIIVAILAFAFVLTQVRRY